MNKIEEHVNKMIGRLAEQLNIEKGNFQVALPGSRVQIHCFHTTGISVQRRTVESITDVNRWNGEDFQAFETECLTEFKRD